MPHATHKGVRIWYEERGEGRTLVMLQGLGLSSRFWLSAPEDLAKKFRVILIDNRGTGRSDRPRGLYSIAGMARDSLAVVDALKLERFVVAGISMGGMIAQELALRVAPERLEGLVLLATTSGLPKGKIPSFPSLLRLARGARRTPKNLQALRRVLASPEALRRDPDMFAEFDALMAASPTPVSVFLRHLLAASLHSTSRRLDRIACPTLVVTGDADRLIPPQNSHLLCRLIPGARLKLISGAGHVFPLERRDLLASLLGDFLESLRPAAEPSLSRSPVA